MESTQKLLHTHEKDQKMEPLKHIEILMVEPWRKCIQCFLKGVAWKPIEVLMVEPWECFENNSW